MVVCILCLLFTLTWVGLWSINVAFPGHIYLLFHLNGMTLESKVKVITLNAIYGSEREFLFHFSFGQQAFLFSTMIADDV